LPNGLYLVHGWGCLSVCLYVCLHVCLSFRTNETFFKNW